MYTIPQIILSSKEVLSFHKNLITRKHGGICLLYSKMPSDQNLMAKVCLFFFLVSSKNVFSLS